MSIYSRSYMRDNYGAPGPAFDAVKVILISLVAVFLVQMVAAVWIRSDFVTNYFGLSLENLGNGLLYTFFTYGYLHETGNSFPLHLLINALVLYFAGRYLQMRLGSLRVFELFHLSVLAGGLLWVLVSLFTGARFQLIGASGGVFGFLVLFSLLNWHDRIRFLLFFVIPVEMTGRMIFYILLGVQAFFFLFGELPGAAHGTAYSAHLGGIAMAWLYNRYLITRPPLSQHLRLRRTSTEAPAWKKRGQAAKERGGRFSVNLKSARSTAPRRSTRGLRPEVDRILDKINEKGFGALSDEEKRTLDRAKDEL